ncbi:Serine 3-dehydrogenase [Fusobacterium necrophorum subsp. funduliforme]|uniref:SDR family oxidoreductase n=1 Tax=Fusobacterium necrophorum TaxID=859 RepID=UPI001B8B5F3B|nr:SDR family oxidoreductase [Fusobacterium necrophorum]MBR8722666.1 Serine 3-dehydrogenase [Fusobacterium necrophorum subsp. funduliforme]
MKVLVTGATSGIGRVLVERLLQEGNEVLGIGRDFQKYPLEHPKYQTYSCDLRKMAEVEKLLRVVASKDWDAVILVAGLGYFAPHEEIHFSKIQEMVQVNLSSAMMLVQASLRSLKKTKGHILFLSSVTAGKASPIGAAYSATKAGLSHFATSLWEEVRKYGVRVSVVEPDMTKTDFYKHNSFDVGEEEDSYLLAEEVVEAVLFLFSQRKEVNIRRIEIQPQRHRITRRG